MSSSTLGNDNISLSDHDDVVHSIKCNSVVTGLDWRKTRLSKHGFGDHELLSSHGSPGFEVKLWQINKYTHRGNSGKHPLYINGKEVKYWFTKVKDVYGHEDQILNSILSPDSSTLATLGADETLRFWKMFESYEAVSNLKAEKGKRS